MFKCLQIMGAKFELRYIFLKIYFVKVGMFA